MCKSFSIIFVFSAGGREGWGFQDLIFLPHVRPEDLGMSHNISVALPPLDLDGHFWKHI